MSVKTKAKGWVRILGYESIGREKPPVKKLAAKTCRNIRSRPQHRRLKSECVEAAAEMDTPGDFMPDQTQRLRGRRWRILPVAGPSLTAPLCSHYKLEAQAREYVRACSLTHSLTRASCLVFTVLMPKRRDGRPLDRNPVSRAPRQSTSARVAGVPLGRFSSVGRWRWGGYRPANRPPYR